MKKLTKKRKNPGNIINFPSNHPYEKVKRFLKTCGFAESGIEGVFINRDLDAKFHIDYTRLAESTMIFTNANGSKLTLKLNPTNLKFIYRYAKRLEHLSKTGIKLFEKFSNIHPDMLILEDD